MLRELVGNILGSSIINLFEDQPDILEHTSETTMTEWNVCHHFANEVSKYIFWLNHEVDVGKRNYHNKRPDIIFHRRRRNTLNFLIIELKHDNNPIDEDLLKIGDWMRQGDLRYDFGASVQINAPNCYRIELFTQERREPLTITEQDRLEYIEIPSVGRKNNSNLKRLAQEIYDLGAYPMNDRFIPLKENYYQSIVAFFS
jgi:hypothetical protein